jgi:hypothetical protein
MIPDDEAMSDMRVMLVLNRIDEWWCLWQIDDGHMASWGSFNGVFAGKTKRYSFQMVALMKLMDAWDWYPEAGCHITDPRSRNSRIN